MAKITRYDGNLKPFADDSLGTERTVFGAETQSDALDDNINADFLRGWGIVGVNQLPTKQDFNAFAYTSTALTSYLYQMGIAEWNASQEYFTGSITNKAGILYRAVQDNDGVDPATDDGSNWLPSGFSTPLTTKGDIYVRGAEDTRLAVGSNGKILSANSEEDTGLEWIDPPEVFNSTANSFALNTLTTVAHGLGVEPDVIQIIIECNDADNGWAVGDRARFEYGQNDSTSASGIYVYSDETNVYVRTTSTLRLPNKSTGGSSNSFTPSDWSMYVKAIKI